MQWSTITVENYREKLAKFSLDCDMWHYFHIECGFSVSKINAAFEIAYRIHTFTRGRRVMELFAGDGLLGFILLKHHWATYIYQTDMEVDVLEDEKKQTKHYPIEDIAKKLGILQRWCFIHANIKYLKHLRVLDTCHFDVIVSICGCGSLTDFAIEFAAHHHVNVIFAPCCSKKVRKTKHYSSFLNVPSYARVNGMRVERLISYGYNVRARISRCLTNNMKFDTIVPVYIANLPQHRNKRRCADVMLKFARYQQILQKSVNVDQCKEFDKAVESVHIYGHFR